jgi:hypothetical protein
MRKIDEIKFKLNAIKNSLNDKSSIVDSVYEKYLKDLPSSDQLFGKKLDEFLDNRKKKIENRKDIFSELLEIISTFTDSSKGLVNSNNLLIKDKVTLNAIEALKVTLESSREIIEKNIKSSLFSGDGICGANTVIKVDEVRIKPKEIDFLNILTIDPETNVGKIIYEPETPDIGKQKVNRRLYNTFTSSDYTFTTNGRDDLFTASWSTSNQEFFINGLTQFNSEITTETFLTDYFASVEFPNFEEIIKNAMLFTIQGDGSDNPQFNKSLNDLDRLLKKLFAICGSDVDKTKLKNQNPLDLFNENEETVEYYFDFNDVEGIDLDLEEARYKKVMRFTDCNNFEAPINTTIFEDFVYLSDKKPINELISTTLNKLSSDVYENTDGNIPQSNFNISLINTFILNLPKALIASVLSPKIFLPIVIIYKSINNDVIEDSKDLMKRFSKMYYNIIKEIYWTFIREFWKRVKVDLYNFIKTFVSQIIKTKYKRYVTIIKSMTLLKLKIKFNDIDNCNNLFNTIINSIDSALSTKGSFSVPGLLLAFSDSQSGFSNERALLNIFNRIESEGISLGPVFEEENNLPKIIKSIINGLVEEIDQNAYIKTSNKQFIIPSQTGAIVIPPGTLNSSGKFF